MEILQPGYRIGDRILRPARVAVAEPEPEPMRPEPVEAAFDQLRPHVGRRASSSPTDESVEATAEPVTDEPAGNREE